MEEYWIEEYRSGPEYLENWMGVSWYDLPELRWWQRIFHRHKAQTRGFMLGANIQRCRCGAYGPSPWLVGL